jgi:PAS domain S-box-containing protein
MRLRTQFLISLFVFALLIALVVSYVFVMDLQLRQLEDERELARKIGADASTLGSTSIDYYLTRHDMSHWRATMGLLYVEVSKLDAISEQELITIIQSDLENANETFNQTAMPLDNAPLNQSALMDPAYKDAMSSTSMQVQQLALDAQLLVDLIEQQKNQVNQTYLVLIITLIGLFVAYFFLVYQLFFKRTLHSIATLRAKTKKINSDLPPSSGKPPQDELDQLTSEFEGVLGSWEKTVASKEALETEVSERKKAEQALQEAQVKLQEYTRDLEKIVDERTKKIRENEQSYRELYESFGEAFIATDWELTIIHWNNAAELLTNVKASDALGKKIYEVLPEMDLVDVTPYFELLQNKQPARFMMNSLSRQTNAPAIYEISTYPATQGIIIIVEDKTEEEQTKRLSAIGQTAGMVGHDIRNPLQAITSDLYLIREELKDSTCYKEQPGLQESLSTIEENVFYINKIVSDLQDYTRPLAPVCRKVNIADLLQNTLKAVHVPQNIEVNVEAPKDLVIDTDPDYLMRALTNLVTNAGQAMPNGGKLSLKAKKAEASVVISVRDTGVGIPTGVRERIFTPLFTTKSKGQGLGLAVVKRLVEGLGGTISFESWEGEGTEFRMELPMN